MIVRANPQAPIRVVAYGDRALLIEVDVDQARATEPGATESGATESGRTRDVELDTVLGLFGALERDRPPGVVDIVPAARTVAVVLDPHVLPLDAARRWIERTAPEPPSSASHGVVELPVRYDGDDLAEVAALLGITPREVAERHSASRWRVAFSGFAPGFAYLVTDHDDLHVPRRPTPRTAVPAGSVGLAGAFSGVYPRSSPGGWQLIGRTDAVLWDASADPPALLRPGVEVRFVPVAS